MELIERNQEQFFVPGDVVELKQGIDNKPKMIVKSIDKISDLHEKPKLLGVTCQWFNIRQELQVARFSTKDLIRV